MSLSAALRVAAASISSSCCRLISPFQDFAVHAHNVELSHEANCFVRVSLVVAGSVNYSPPAVTSDHRQCVSSRLLCGAVLRGVATMVEVVVEGSRGARRPLYLQLLTGGHCAPSSLPTPPALTSQPWLTWFVVAPRSEGGSWIMSSYSLRGGPWLVDYRIALTDQKELWLLSKSPHKER